MNHQSDIADILGTMSNGPIVGGHKSKIEELLKHFAGGGAHTSHMCGQAAPGPQGFDAEAVRLCAVARIPRLLPAPHEAEEDQEGEGRMNKFVADIEARLAIISQMIKSANTTERRALQKERADLEAKLRKVSA